MTKLNRIDVAARRPGAIMRQARQMCKMSTDDAAIMLRIMPDELAAYERSAPAHTGTHICHGIQNDTGSHN